MIKKDNHSTQPWVCTIRGHGVHYHRRFATRREAEDFAAMIRTTHRESQGDTNGEASGAQTFESFVRECIEEQNGTSATIGPGTVVGWESKLNRMPRWFRKRQLHRITPQHCFEYLQWLLNKQREK